MIDSVKVTVEIDVPASWEAKPDPKYTEIRKKIYSTWALVKLLTGKTSEEWLWENDSHLYKDGGIAFLDASKAIDKAIEAVAVKLGQPLEMPKRKPKYERNK